MRRLLLIAFVAVILLASAFSASAESTPSLIIEGVLSPRRKKITLSVSAENAEGLSAFMLSLEYDSSCLAYTESKAQKGAVGVNSSEEGRLNLVFFLEEGLENTSAQKLFSLSFSCEKAASQTFKLRAFDAIDSKGEDVSLYVPRSYSLYENAQPDSEIQQTLSHKTRLSELAGENRMSIRGESLSADIYIAFICSLAVVFTALLWAFLTVISKRKKPYPHLIFEDTERKKQEENNEEN